MNEHEQAFLAEHKGWGHDVRYGTPKAPGLLCRTCKTTQSLERITKRPVEHRIGGGAA